MTNLDIAKQILSKIEHVSSNISVHVAGSGTLYLTIDKQSVLRISNHFGANIPTLINTKKNESHINDMINYVIHRIENNNPIYFARGKKGSFCEYKKLLKTL